MEMVQLVVAGLGWVQAMPGAEPDAERGVCTDFINSQVALFSQVFFQPITTILLRAPFIENSFIEI